MIIRCWGARGSIPTSGKNYLRYGGNTTCLEIRNSRNDVLMVDAGSGIREAGNALLTEGRRDFTLILTHAHWDHIMGFPFFKPLYRKKTTLNIWGCSFAQDSVKEMLARVMSAPYFPIHYDDVQARVDYQATCDGEYRLGDLAVTPVQLSHPNQGNGYKFSQNGKSFVFLTDNELGFRHPGGLAFDDYLDFCKGADLLIHDAEYDDKEYPKRRGWGHSTVEQATKLAIEAGVKQLGLFHHNQDRHDDDIDAMVAASRSMIADHHATLDCFAVYQSMEIVP